MKRSATLFLRAVLVLIGIGAFVFLLWEPHLEGRNANATLFEVYFKDPFLAYAYAGSVPFFIGLHQAWKVLGYAAKDLEFSAAAISSVRTIKYCALALIGFVVLGEVFIMLADSDDRAGGVAIGLFIIAVSMVVAAAMAVVEPALQSAADKSGSDSTG